MAEAIDLPTFEALQQTTGSAFVAELATLFLGEAPKMIETLRSTQRSGDAEGFRRAAHSLKSNSNTFGALTLGGMARALELSGAAAMGQGEVPTLEAVEGEFARVAEALETLANA